MKTSVINTLETLIDKHTRHFGYPPSKLFLPDEQYNEFLGLTPTGDGGVIRKDQYGDWHYKDTEIHRSKERTRR